LRHLCISSSDDAPRPKCNEPLEPLALHVIEEAYNKACLVGCWRDKHINHVQPIDNQGAHDREPIGLVGYEEDPPNSGVE